jgi:RNA polymerase sigma-54 factor
MLTQKLQQKLLQKLSPQQIQMIKLLEIPTMQLEQRIKKELEENPALEEGLEDEDPNLLPDEEETDDDETQEKKDNEFSLEDFLDDDDDIPAYKLYESNYSKDDERKEIPFSAGPSFHESIQNQLSLRTLSERQVLLSEYIIGNIDDDGYLRREIDAIIDDLAFSQNISTSREELLSILTIIQELDPAGIGARDLQECLLLQLLRKDQKNKNVKLATKIIKDYFPEFTKKHYDKIASKLNIDDQDLKSSLDEILRLNPKPGGAYNEEQNKSFQTITPDFMLENNEGRLTVSLNARNAPDLRVSGTYAQMLEDYSASKDKNKNQKDAATFVKQKIEAAKWFIDAIKQRQNTLLLTMEAIIRYQKEFFIDGDETKLHPMILKDIADATNLDISTISRVANSKFIQTHFGIYPLKFFFSEGMQNDSGEEVSTREIKKILQDSINAENKRKPLTDDRLAKVLKEKGYNIARRTVAKYREQLNIPVGRLRKELL